MAERRPPGFNVDLGFYDSPEVRSIPRRIRAAAIGVWTLCGSYSANKLQDGYVDSETLSALGCTPAIRAALTATKPEPLWVDDEHSSGVWFTRWPKWQRTRAEVKRYRDTEAERKRNARNAKRNAATSTETKVSGRTDDGPPQNVPPDHRDPKTKTETETKTEKEPLVASSVCVEPVTANAATTHHPEFCPAHPHGTPDPCGPCANARKANAARQRTAEEADIAAARADTLARMAAIERANACPRCDDHGWALDPDGQPVEPATRCTHPAGVPA